MDTTVKLRDSGYTVVFKSFLSHKASKIINRGTTKAVSYSASADGEVGISGVDLEAMEVVYEDVFPHVVEDVKDKDNKKVEDLPGIFEDLSQYDFNQIVVRIDQMNEDAQELIKKRRTDRKRS